MPERRENMIRFILALYILIANGAAVPGAVMVAAWCLAGVKYLVLLPLQVLAGLAGRGNGWGNTGRK